jgi:hypothetical protein
MRYEDVLGDMALPQGPRTPRAIMDEYIKSSAPTVQAIERVLKSLGPIKDEISSPLAEVRDVLQTRTVADNVPVFQWQLQFANRDVFQHVLNSPGGEEVYKACIADHHQWCRWVVNGCSTFELTHSLAAGLVLTEPPPLEEDSFKLPFDSFTIVLPDGVLPFWYGETESSNQKWANLVLVSKFKAASDGKAIYQITSYCDGVSLYRRQKFAELDSPEADDWVKAFEDDPPITSNDAITHKTALRIVRNLVAWIEANGPGERQGGKRPPKKNRKPIPDDPNALPTPTTWVVGREIKLSPDLRQMASEVVLGESKKDKVAGWKVRVRYIVRGHWRMQAHGVGRAERKRMFISPFWRGPLGAAAWSHLYQPEEQTT